MHDLGRWPGADDLLDRALDLPPARRRDFVRSAAGDDAELRAALEAVLAEAAAADGFLAPGGASAGALGLEVEQALAAEAGDALQPGDVVEDYEVVGLLGRGGMGEVYRARDRLLGREVALKVLPAPLAAVPERVARFQREARLLAALTHPGIAALYGVAEDRGVEALVLELVEGPTLADRLAAGALPMDDVLALGRAIAEAVAAAHARGVLHRDLKPANIKLPPGGGVKILDFGLARAMAPAEGEDTAVAPTDLTSLAEGALLGTAPYMSPEQVRGEPADARSDIWAFGCVLFEMLTGTRAFTGDTRAEVCARVLEREPAFVLLPAGTPEPIRRLLRRCLEKDARRRLAAVADARLEFDDAQLPSAAAVERVAPGRRWRGLAAAALAGLAAGAGAAVLWLRAPEATPAEPWRLSVVLPRGDVPPTSYQPAVTITPDGGTVLYRAQRDGLTRVYARALDSVTPVAVPGTEHATGLAVSPDGRWLAFDANGVLTRVPLAGGAALRIADAPGGATATWAPDDTIIFATNTSRVLQRVPASGGVPQALTTLDAARGDTLHLLPQALPDGRTVLFTVAAGARQWLAALRLDTRAVRLLGPGTHARYVGDGTVLFVRGGSLWRASFDLETLALGEPAQPVADGVAATDGTVYHYDVAADGTIVYLPGDMVRPLQRLAWVDRDGRLTPLPLEPRAFGRAVVAPDGQRLAVAITEGDNTDVWVAEPSRGVMTRLTFEASIETAPVWSPDGRFVTFRSEQQGPGVFRRDAQGAGAIERLTATAGPIHSPSGWTPDGRTLLFALFHSGNRQAIAAVTPPEGGVQVLLDGDFAQLNPQVSPDGRWLAYQSNESGRHEIYVRRWPEVDVARWQVSTDGGTVPRWGPGGRELFFLRADGLYTTGVSAASGAFRADAPRRLLALSPAVARQAAFYDVSPDGRRFLFAVDADAAAERAPAQLVVIGGRR
jgi:Tol biopolymer transport system component